MSWTLEGIEQTIYLWQSLHITTTTNRASVWRLIKPYSGDHIDCACVGQSWMRIICLELRLSKRL